MFIIILWYNNNMPSKKLSFDPNYIDIVDPEVLKEMDESNKKYKALRDKQKKKQKK